MISFKNGVLRLSFDRDAFDILWDISLLFLLVSITTIGNTVKYYNYIYYVSFFLFILVSFADFVRKNNIFGKVVISYQTIWYSGFILLAFISVVWAYEPSVVFIPMERMVQNLAITFGVINSVRTNRDVGRLSNIFIVAAVIMCLYVFAKTPSGTLLNGFAGMITGYNSNDVGFIAATGVTVSFYKAYVKRSGIINYLAFAICMTMVLLTSSRKALLMSVFGIVLLATFSIHSRSISLVKLAIALAIAASAIVAIFKVELLYNLMGVRIEEMLAFFFEDSAEDISMNKREYYIRMGRQFFFENPVLGLGFNNFTVKIHSYGGATSYAHNNYIQIASDLGTVGLITYYWFYFYMLFKLIKQVAFGKREATLYLTVMLLIMVFEYGIVDYYKTTTQILLAMIYSNICANDYEEVLKRYAARAERKTHF